MQNALTLVNQRIFISFWFQTNMKLVFCTRKLSEGRSGLLRSLKISAEQNFPSYEPRQKLPEREVVFSNLPPAILAPVKVGIAGDVCLMKGCNPTE